MTVTFFTVFSPQSNVNASEKYYLTVYLYLKVSHSKSYKTIQHCRSPCLEGKMTSPTRVRQKQHGPLFLFSEKKPPISTSPSDSVHGSTCENVITNHKHLPLGNAQQVKLTAYNFGTLRCKGHLPSSLPLASAPLPLH